MKKQLSTVLSFVVLAVLATVAAANMIYGHERVVAWVGLPADSDKIHEAMPSAAPIAVAVAFGIVALLARRSGMKSREKRIARHEGR